jgi:sugar phosphate isomerase/epimerase
VIERHITISRESEGLDHSSSSTISEFKQICRIAQEIDVLMLGNGPKVPNQGELLNKQNLGRSYFAQKNLETGSLIIESDFEYRSPLTGINGLEFRKFIGKSLCKSVSENEPLTASHLLPADPELSLLEIETARDMNLSIPVRLGDFKKITSELPVGSFEFHLSFEEILSDLSDIEINQSDNFSVHLPDYIDSRNLIDPWANNSDIRERSFNILRKTVQFADWLGKTTNKKVPVVASLSSQEYKGELFYRQADELFRNFNGSDSQLTLQWLPPIAWYFGGSVPLHVMNDEQALVHLLKYKIPITMDYSHLILGRNYFGFDAFRILEELSSQIVHIHICDAQGIDGEGMQIGQGDAGNIKLLKTATSFSTLKVIEVWQGHLDGLAGFKKAVRELAKFKENE